MTSLLTAGASVTGTVVVVVTGDAGGTAALSSLEPADFVPLPETFEVASSVESESSEESGSSARGRVVSRIEVVVVGESAGWTP